MLSAPAMPQSGFPTSILNRASIGDNWPSYSKYSDEDYREAFRIPYTIELSRRRHKNTRKSTPATHQPENKTMLILFIAQLKGTGSPDKYFLMACSIKSVHVQVVIKFLGLSCEREK